ncbi:hypothetical protein D6D19_08538 [Aureobasidium pullulans]|uniref:Uncharacterized protein n=1 Tax=Aureobasidium pullulans TaxID=5580 RepID=A0A4S8ZSB6_AURPU|nr:hypothetical protein D6D19_08538 [Aureobasidium pullulans]THY30100.1 hypothetical protein D6D00_03102 [Aureobasidium pullulans]
MSRRRRPARPGALADLAPKRILAQIVVLQLLYYAVAAALILFTTLVAGRDVTADLLLSWRTVRSDVTTGWMLGLCWMMDSLICVIFLLLFIARSKLVPDFAITIHVINLIVTTFYTKELPTQIFWWGLQFCSTGLMIFLGVWACQWRELKPISFGGKGKQPVTVSDPAAVEEGAGFAREGRGAGNDGAGVYEMVGMPPRDHAA